LAGELPVVVDLAIVDDPDAPILVAHRLVAGGRQVDERQAAVHELAPLVRPVALAVRAPMGEQRGRPSGPTRVGGQAVGVETPGYAAHIRKSSTWVTSTGDCKRCTARLPTLRACPAVCCTCATHPRPSLVWQSCNSLVANGRDARRSVLRLF